MKVPAVLNPALHTLWQSLAAGLATWYASVNLGAVHNVDDAKKLALSGIAAGVAALLSAALHVGKTYGPGLLASVSPVKVSNNELAMIEAVLEAAAAETASEPAP